MPGSVALIEPLPSPLEMPPCTFFDTTVVLFTYNAKLKLLNWCGPPLRAVATCRRDHPHTPAPAIASALAFISIASVPAADELPPLGADGCDGRLGSGCAFIPPPLCPPLMTLPSLGADGCAGRLDFGCALRFVLPLFALWFVCVSCVPPPPFAYQLSTDSFPRHVRPGRVTLSSPLHRFKGGNRG